jgi:hypothetical protein
MRIARTNPGSVGRAVTGAAAAEEGEDRRRKGRQRAKTLSAHTVESTMCRARAVLAFSDGYDLSGIASMRLGAWGANKTATSEETGHLRLTKLTASESSKGREIGSGGIGRV